MATVEEQFAKLCELVQAVGLEMLITTGAPAWLAPSDAKLARIKAAVAQALGRGFKDVFDGMTHAEQLKAYTDLARRLCGVGVPLGPEHWIVPISGFTFEARSHNTFCVTPHVRFRPRRLIIFEPKVEKVLPRAKVIGFTEHVTESKKWWFGKTKKIIEQVPIFGDEVVEETIARSGWRIHAIFVGAEVQMPNIGALSGDAFAGNDPNLDFAGYWCERGISIAVQVENTRSIAAPFLGAFVGEYDSKEREEAEKARRLAWGASS